MEDYKKLQCRLCLSIVSAENCKEIDDVLWNILDVILLKQNFDSRSKHTICDTCLQKAREAFKFKLMCLYTNEIVIPHNNDETKFSVDLKKIYMREKGKGQLTDTLDYEVCRLCMQLILGESMSVHEMKADVIEKYIPEIKLSVITSPIVCGQCFYSFDTHSSFINNCLENIKDASATRSHGSVHWGASKYTYIETEGIDIKCEESEPFNELIKIESAVTKLEDKEISIKTEYDELELEDSNSPSEISSYILENKYRPAMIRTPKKKSIKQKKIIYKNHTPSNRCDRCGREFNKCDCETELEGNLKKLQFRYGSPSELQTYKCDTCEYESENKRNFTSHQLVHKDSTDVQMYKCDTCHFMSKYKCNRDRHQLKHSKHLDMEMYKCDLCKFKNNLKCHHLIHMDASKVQMYICNLCDFKTKFNYKLNDHQFKHAVRSEIHMYKCDLCDFKTKYKNTFNVHQLKHADPSEVQMYKCDLCDFKTKYKHILRIHKTKHLDTSNV